MFERIKGFFMNILKYFQTYTIEEVTGIKTNISSEMYNKINLWVDMASGQAPWNDKAKPCGILDQITGNLHSMVNREIGLKVENPAIESVMLHLNSNVDKIVDFVTLFGGCLLRPIFSNNKLQYELIPLGNYLPTRYDFDGTLTGALVFKQIINANHKFLLTENHIFENNNHSVKCMLYNNDKNVLRKVSLSACPQTENLTEEYTWQNVKMPMVVEFRNHAVNKIDGSLVPVALIAGAENLIQDADEQYERMNWEQKSAERKVFADRDMFARRKMRNGEIVGTVLSKDMNRLIMQIEGDGTNNGKITEFSPGIRTTEQNAMLQQIFRRIELATNIGKGTISDMENVAQTATQYNGGRQALWAIVDLLEDEIEKKYKLSAEVFAYMAAAYKLGANNAKITIMWNDDQTRKDIQQAKMTAMQEITTGVKQKWEYRRDFFGEDEETAKANVPQNEAQSFNGMFGMTE